MRTGSRDGFDRRERIKSSRDRWNKVSTREEEIDDVVAVEVAIVGRFGFRRN